MLTAIKSYEQQGALSCGFVASQAIYSLPHLLDGSFGGHVAPVGATQGRRNNQASSAHLTGRKVLSRFLNCGLYSPRKMTVKTEIQHEVSRLYQGT